MDSVSSRIEPISTSVLVVGGSLVGLSAAMFLGLERVPTLLLEPHLGSHRHPRAIGYTARTLELFRSAGIAQLVPEAPRDFRLRRCKAESLAGKWFEASDWTPKTSAALPLAAPEYSPHTGAAIAQDRLEPILRERAKALGADLRLGSELLRFEQDRDGITAVAREKASGREYTIRAAYLIAADGSKSSVRQALGFGQTGPGLLRTMRSVLFRAPLEQYLSRGISQFEINQDGFAAFLTTYGDGRWVLMFMDDLERDEATLHAAIQRAIGRSDLPVEILTTGRWELSAAISERFASGRVFLAGDAAHTLPPTRGGFGANTGIHDAHNLAWKLAAVLSGASSPALLDSYDAERRPVAWTRLEQTFARPDYAAHGGGFAQNLAILDDDALEFGQLYRSCAVIGAGDELPAAALPDQWAGQPGTRAPHLWLEHAATRRSTLDLFGRGWMLLALDPRWAHAAAHAASTARFPLGCTCVDTSPQRDAVQQAFGLGASGASLVRPDGVVAWRATEIGENSGSELAAALLRVASSPTG
ncbi:MAG TPA: FAD-dependent oxidoreductase [Polyangiaceae bacterium]|nr:FAD-dependent oxidoreductase [Polyangiaceae bacterium]